MSTEDLNKYNGLAQQQAKKLFPAFNMSKFYAAENADPLVFCHFAENIQDQVYDQVEHNMMIATPMQSIFQMTVVGSSCQWVVECNTPYGLRELQLMEILLCTYILEVSRQALCCRWVSVKAL